MKTPVLSILPAALLYIFVQNTNAQTVTATSGTTYSNGSNSVDFTIGEPVTSTTSNSANTATQGFHQPEFKLTDIEQFDAAHTFELYPNPAQQSVNIQASKAIMYHVDIYDINGKKIYTQQNADTQTTLDVLAFVPGTYVVVLSDPDGRMLQRFKLVKQQ